MIMGHGPIMYHPAPLMFFWARDLSQNYHKSASRSMQPERISVLGTGRMRQQEKYLYRVAICDYMAKRFLPELIGSEFRVQGVITY
jgi:hypothetical protein